MVRTKFCSYVAVLCCLRFVDLPTHAESLVVAWGEGFGIPSGLTSVTAIAAGSFHAGGYAYLWQ